MKPIYIIIVASVFALSQCRSSDIIATPPPQTALLVQTIPTRTPTTRPTQTPPPTSTSLPTATPTPTTVPTPSPAPTPTGVVPPLGGVFHVVHAGDTLWDLSGLYYQDWLLWPIICDTNQLTDCDLILIGQRLYIPELFYDND